MQIELEYGRTGIEVEIPDANVAKVMQYREAPALPNPDEVIAQALDAPIGTKSLSELAKGKRTVCILVCDFTRPVPNEMMLAPMLERLSVAGIEDSEICILVATGLHRACTESELREILGDAIVDRYRVENHDGLDKESHVYLGESPNGVPIWIDRRYVEADLKITVGLIEPHFMAGFSGGRKLICPGIAAIETVKVWHSPRFLESPFAMAGVLENNPVHFENTWIAQKAGCDLIANVVIDAKRQPLAFFVGDMIEAFEAGVEFVRSVVRDTIPEPADIVVTSAAGYPLDATYYQTVKGMVAALPVVKQGGTVIIASACSEGIGSPEFQRIFEDFDHIDPFMEAITSGDYFQMDQWQLEELAKAIRHAKVVLVSGGITAEMATKMFVHSADSVESALQEALAEHGPGATIAVIPKGPYVMAELSQQ